MGKRIAMKIIVQRVFIFILCLVSLNTRSQSKLGNTWIVGTFGYQINFDSNPVAHDTSGLPSYWHLGHSNICDTNGRLLLCSDGMNIYDSTGIYIDGGDTLVPKDFYNYFNGVDDLSQASIILPMDSNIFYLVTQACSDSHMVSIMQNGGGYFDLLLYDKIDMKANAGMGKVVQKMKPIIENGNLSNSQMMACRHGNGKDWWVLKMAEDSVNVNTVLLKQDTVINMGIQRFPFIGDGGLDGGGGQMQINQQGTQMSTVNNGFNNLPLSYIYTADFDRCTGLLSSYKKTMVPTTPTGYPIGQLQLDSSALGLCYSPNGRFLYLIKYSGILQLDLLDNNISTAWYQVSGMDTAYNWFAGYTNAYLGPDGKIYIGTYHGTSKQMSTIDNPDIKGSGCNFCRKCLRSKAVYAWFSSPPCMPNYNLSGNGCWPASITEIEKNNPALVVYPNPACTVLTIQGVKEIEAVIIYNQLGQEVKKETANEKKIDIHTLSKGMYTIHVEANGKAYFARFLKE